MSTSAHVLQALGDTVQSRWSAVAFDDERLSEIATAALESHRPHESVGLDDLDQLVFQSNAASSAPLNEVFGDAAITLYRAPRFVIEALVWTNDTTTIHQHGFSGAFTVLRGASIHSRYDFHRTERINASFAVGDLVFRGAELLSRGDIRAIESGPRLIHNVFHVEAPSITLVIRTSGRLDTHPQLNYLPPGLASDPFFKDPVLAHQLRFLRMLLDLESTTAGQRIRSYLGSADLHAAYRTLEFLHESLVEHQLWDQALSWAAQAHPGKAETLRAAFEELVRRQDIVAQRRAVRDSKLRFFLAMLLSVPSRSQIREFVRAHCPDEDPDSQIVQWIAELLDLNGIPYDEGNLDIIRFALEGSSDEHVVARLKESYDAHDVESQLPQILTVCRQLEENRILQHLFHGE